MKSKRFISLILVFVILLSSMSVLAETGGDEGAREAGIQNGKSDAETLANANIRINEFDIYSDKIKPSEGSLEKYLKGKSEKYRATFINAYYRAFEDRYNEKMMADVVVKGSAYSRSLGSALGALHGERDYRKGKSSDTWKISILSNTKIVTEYSIGKESIPYKRKFINEFKEGYIGSYEVAYDDAKFKPIINATTRGERDGSLIGGSLGGFFGEKDALENKGSDYTNHIPSDNYIREYYKLAPENGDFSSDEEIVYSEAFLAKYKMKFKEEYNISYRETLLENINEPAKAHGFEKGFDDGEILAEKKIKENKFKPYDDSLKESEESVKNKYVKNKDSLYQKHFLDGYYYGFERGFNQAMMSGQDARATEQSEKLGKALGEIHGERDYRAGKSSSEWEKSIPSVDEIIETYDLDKETVAYKRRFIEDFTLAYKEAYEESYDAAKFDPILVADERGKRDGELIGGSLGDFFGEKDALENKESLYSRQLPTDAQIRSYYKLAPENGDFSSNDEIVYSEAFLAYFKIYFKEEYKRVYRETLLAKINVPAESNGFDKGFNDGEILAREKIKENIFDPYNSSMKPNEQIVINKYVKNKDEIYKKHFIDGYYEGFERGFNQAMMTEDEARASDYSSDLGSALGEIHGERDYRDGKSSLEWVRSIPKVSEIIAMYDLDKESVAYKRKFIDDFTLAYKEAYEEAYDDAKFKPSIGSAERGKADGSSIGASIGSFYGKLDAEYGRDLDYMRNLPSDARIISNYNLNKDTVEYKNAFINAFKLAFRESYESSYRDANIGIIESQAKRAGYRAGRLDGESLAKEYERRNELKPYALVKPSESEIRRKYNKVLDGKDPLYISDFLEGYFEGHKEAYELIISHQGHFQEGYNKGYSYGTSLATKNNTNETFEPYEKVALSNNEIITISYEDLKDKDANYILLFVEGFQKGFKEGYNKTIKSGKEPEKPEDISSGYGASLGMIYGEIAGIRDYQSGIKPNARKAMPNSSQITIDFGLQNLASYERFRFIQSFQENFIIGYEKAYYNEHYKIIIGDMSTGREHGSTFGAMIGKVYGSKDYYEGRNSDFMRNRPTEKKIIEEYSLKRNSSKYSEGFVNGFMNSYEDAYIESFREAKNMTKGLEDAEAFDNGKAVGESRGKIQASMDHMSKKDNNWQRSQPLASTILDEYDLMYQRPKYRDAFLTGFWDGYANGYTEIYRTLSQDSAMSKLTSDTIAIAGGSLESLDGALSVEIPSGIYYKPVILNIENLNKLYAIDKRYISASNFYRLSVLNPSEAHGKDKKIKVSFEYYGDKDGGVYILDKGNWHYLSSTLEEGRISVELNPSTLNKDGNVFAVLVDQETEIFYDIRGHWARDEIRNYIRNDVINGYTDKTFKPERKITRAEFLVLLSRQYKWYMPYDTGNTKVFRDYDSFNRFSIKHISHATRNKYIVGYPDKTFKPYDHISYKEVDIIMRRILKDSSFKWSDYAEKMMYEKKIRSSSYDSYNNNITRAEFSYMLYNLYQWKY